MGSQQGAHAERLAKKILDRRKAGESITDDDIQKDFPELSSEIFDWIQMLTAVSKARDRHKSGERIDLSTAEEQDDLEFLSKALPDFIDFRVLTKGGQSSVWLAKNSVTQETVVVKLLLDGPFATESSQRRFERESRILRKIDHPYIVRIIDNGVVRGRQYILTEFIDGLAIDNYAFALGSDLDARLRVLRKVCQAIAAAHEVGVIHRDLKPSNILVRNNETPCIIDFGLSKDTLAIRDSGAIQTSASGARFGTAAYLSPEQTTPGVAIDHRVDIYALGIILFETIADRFPYNEHDNLISVVRNVLTEDPVALARAMRESTHAYQEPREKIRKLDAIIRKAMDKDRERRYSSATKMADDIQQLLNQKPVTATRGALFRRIERVWIRRRRVMMVGLALIMFALIAVNSFRFALDSAGRRDRAERSLELERIKVFGELQDAHRENLRDPGLQVFNLNQSEWATSLQHEMSLVDDLRGTDRLRSLTAEKWLSNRQNAIVAFAAELESAVFLMNPGEIDKDAGGIEIESLDIAMQAFDALLANAYRQFAIGDAVGFQRDFQAARNLTLDVGCSLSVIYAYHSCNMRYQLQLILLECFEDCLNTGAMCDAIASLIETQPQGLLVEPMLRQQALRLRRLAADATVTKNEIHVIDHSLLNQRLAGFLDSVPSHLKEQWESSTSLSALNRMIDTHILGNREFEGKTAHEIDQLVKQRWEDLEQARKSSPIAHLCNVYKELYGRRLGLRAREHALHVLIEILRFNKRHNRLPRTLNELTINPEFLTDPMTGKPMEYEVTDSGFQLASPPISSDLVDLTTNRRPHDEIGYDGQRVIFMKR